MKRLALFGCLLSLVGCSRDLVLPEPPGPGSISGRVLLAEPGRLEKAPLGNVEIRILGSGFATVTSPAGTFTLAGVELTSGLLLVRADVNGVTRQRVVQLSDYGAGPKKQVNLGDIVLGENARVRGKVLRGDVSAGGGHSGTTVFVPAGPFTALTADDGSYSFDQMPEGPVELYAFRTGYEPATLGALSLRSGETVELRDLVLAPATSTVPGVLKGRLLFVPEVAGSGDAVVRLISTESAPLTASLTADAEFSFTSVPVGLYRLVATRSGYGQLDVINVLVVSGSNLDIGPLTLTNAPAFDAGAPAMIPDSGVTLVDAGTDAGIDAGVTDAGMGTRCTTQMDCTAGQWCDLGLCVPLCTSNADCRAGNVCDLASTRTCVPSCAGQCAAGQVCNAQNVCQSICDVNFPCPSGNKCSAGMCVPECSINADCNNPFLSCDFGACRRNNLCVVDTDCPREQMCIVALGTGQCGARPTNASVRPDGGTWVDGGLVFACAQACHCRLGERCNAGFCEPDVLVTRFVALDAGGTGLTADAPTSDLRGLLGDGGHVIALLATDAWDVADAGLQLGSQTSLIGGFSQCGPNRWSRDVTAKTSLTGTGAGTAVNGALVNVFASNASVALSNVRVSALTLRPTGLARCQNVSALAVQYVNGLLLEDVDVDFALGACTVSAAANTSIRVDRATAATVRRVRLASATGGGTPPFHFLDFTNSQGLLEDVRTEPFAVNCNTVQVLNLVDLTGATTLRRVFLGRFSHPSTSIGNFQLWVDTCGSVPMLIEDIESEWPNTLSLGSGQSNGVRVEGCANLTMRRVKVTATNHPGGLFDQNYGIYVRDSGGTLADLFVEIPAATNSARRMAGLQLEGPRASFDVSDVVIRGIGGTAQDAVTGLAGVGNQGIRFDNIVSGPLTVRRADISLKGNIAPHGVVTYSTVAVGADVSVVDSRIEVEGINTCQADVIGALFRESVRLERTVITASKGAFTTGVYMGSNATGRVELYGNSIKVGGSAGTSSCYARGSTALFGSYGLVLEGTGNVMKAIGNTFESFGQTGQTGMSAGVACGGTPGLTFASNIVMTGRGSDTRLLSYTNGTGTGCFNPASFSNNYWVNGVPNAVSTQERLFDAGVLLAGGNAFGGTTSCFAAPTALPDGGAGFPHFLTAASPCTDVGVVGVSNAGVTLDRDVFGRPRDGGAGPDLGAVEGP